MKVLDLFSGIGGFSLGLHRAGMETVAFCEYDEKCRKVLTKHWPEVRQYNDVRTLTAEQLENDGINNIGLICGGYPCQPFSLAGKRAGAEDNRHLWPEINRLLAEFNARKKPIPVCLFENVAGHVNMGLDAVLLDLERLGYSAQAFVIPACAVGALHRRDRVFIVAYSDSIGLEANKTLEGKKSKSYNKRSFEPFEVHTDPGRVGFERRAEKPFSGFAHLQGEFFRSGSVLGIRSDRAKPGILGTTNGFRGRVDRCKQLGNAVVPQVVEVIGLAIMEAIRNHNNT